MPELTITDADLYKAVVDAYYAMPMPERANAHWIMGPEWRDRLKTWRASDGKIMWTPGNAYLMGKTFMVRDDGGFPHLEPLPEFTIPEACEVLKPSIDPVAFQRIISALKIPPAGARHDGKPGRPWPTYPWTELERLHKALMPWLTRGDSETQ